MIFIRELEQRILEEGQILPGEVLKVGSFLNQQIDTKLLKAMGEEIARLLSRTILRGCVPIKVFLYERKNASPEGIEKESRRAGESRRKTAKTEPWEG